MTKRSKIIVGILGGIAALFVLAAAVAVMLFPAEKVRAIAEKEASAVLKMPVKIGGLHLTFFGAPAIRAGDVTVGPLRPGDPPLLTVKSFSVRAAFLPLVFERRIEILSVALDSPAVTLTTRKDGSSNLPPADTTRTVQTVPPALPIPLTLRSLTVKNGSFRIVDEAKGSETLLDGIAQKLSLRLGKTMESDGEMSVREVSFLESGKRLPFSGISLGFTHEMEGDPAAGDFTLAKGRIIVNGLPIEVKGKLAGWKTGTFRVETGALDASDVVAAIPDSLLPMKRDISSSGTASLALDLFLDLAGTKPNVSWTGECSIRDITASVRGLPKRIDSLRSTVAVSDTALVFRDMEIRIGGSRATIEGTVRGYLGRPSVSLRANGAVSLDEAAQALPGLAKNGLAGGIDFDIAARGPVQRPDSLLLEGGAELRGFKVSVPKALNHPAEMTGALRITPSAVDLKNLAVKTGKSDFTLSGRLADYRNLFPAAKGAPVRLTGTLSSQLIDLADMVVIDKNIPFPKPWDLEKPLKNLPVPPTLAAVLDIRLGKVTFGRLAADSTRGTLTFAKGVLDLSGLAVAAYKGALKGKARLDVSNPDRIAYGGGFEMKKLDAASLISSVFGAGDNFRGDLSGALSFSGAGLDSISFCKNLTGTGSVLIQNGQFINWEFTKGLGKTLTFLDFDRLDFDTFQTAFTVADQRVLTPAVAVKTGYGGLILSGSTGFDTSLSYDIMFKLNAKAASLAAKNRLGDLADLIAGSNEPELYLTAAGTLKNPSFKIDSARSAKAVKDRIKSETEKFLQKQGGDLQKQGKKLLDKLFR